MKRFIMLVCAVALCSSCTRFSNGDIECYEVDITEVNNAVCKAMEMRMPVSVYAPALADDVADLLEEYGEDNGLPEGWWLEYGDIDDIVEQI